MDWQAFEDGMAAAREAGEPGAHATMREARDWGGPDFEDDPDQSADWHLGYDHAIRLARS